MCTKLLYVSEFLQLIEKETGGAYVNSLKIGHTIIDDTTDGFLMPINKQVEIACGIIANDTNLKVCTFELQ